MPGRPEARVHTRSGNELSYVAPSSMFHTSDGKWLTLAASTQQIFEDLCPSDRPRGPDLQIRALLTIRAACGIARRSTGSLPIGSRNGRATRWRRSWIRGGFRIRWCSICGRLPERAIPRTGNARSCDGCTAWRRHRPERGPKFSASPGAVRHLGPTLGEHNDEVYGELGYTAERLSELREAGVI